MTAAMLDLDPGTPTHVATPVARDEQNLEANALIARHLAGDARAFGELADRFRNRLLNFIYRMIGDRGRAEDLVQEALIRVHRHLHRFDTSKKFTTWVYTIASNLAKNELRNRSRSPLVFYESARAPQDEEHAPLQFEDHRSRPDDMFANRYLKELVDATVAQLAPHQRRVFVLRELEGKSYGEIAEITNCNLGTVKSRLNRARQGFAEMIGPHLN